MWRRAGEGCFGMAMGDDDPATVAGDLWAFLDTREMWMNN